MAWLVSEDKLDDQQKSFYWNENIKQQNIWIKGFPGSGKSVLLAYTVKRIKRESPNASFVLVVFTRSLIAMFEAAFAELGIVVNVVTYYEFLNSGNNYEYILCDEVQDLTPKVIRELNSRGTHVIVAGDENQSIYEKDPKFKEYTVNPSDISSLLSCREVKLKVIHRLSKDIIDIVELFMPNMHIFSGLVDPNHQSTQVRLCDALNKDEEVKYILKEGRRAVREGYSCAVLLPQRDNILDFVNKALAAEGKPTWSPVINNWGNIDYNKMNKYLKEKNIPIKYVGNGYGSFSENDKLITLMTYHSAKGLDFDNVFLPFLNNNFHISPIASLSKTVFMVGLTRSRMNLYLTYSGIKHPYLNSFSNRCYNIDIHRNLSGNNNTGTSTFGF